MNVHDELVNPSSLDTTSVVQGAVEEFKKTVPLLRLNWGRGLSSWASIK
jgi:hypothetical protein